MEPDSPMTVSYPALDRCRSSNLLSAHYHGETFRSHRVIHLILPTCKYRAAGTQSNGNQKQMEDTYTYSALEGKQIRILILYQAQSFDEPLSGRLEVINLGLKRRKWTLLPKRRQTFRKFDALSYVWGDPTKTHVIRLDGGSLAIHKNLYQALLQLRALPLNLPIWTDALCINQADRQERLAQISMMSIIYQKANHVWAWLGPATDHTAMAILAMPTLCRMAKLLLRTGNNGRISYSESRIPQPVWSALNFLMRNEYFDRLWILQEVGLANEITFLCGAHKIKLKTLSEVFELEPALVQFEGFQDLDFNRRKLLNGSVFYLRSLCDHERQPSYRQKFHRFVSNVLLPKYFQITTLDLIPIELQEFAGSYIRGLLQCSRKQKCSFPEDRVFGIMAFLDTMWSGLGVDPGNPPLKLHGNIKELYTRLFEYMFRLDTSLTLLSLAPPSTENVFDLPSWCPDFHHFGFVETFDELNLYFRASSATKAASVDMKSLVMTARGSRFDTVLAVVPGSWISFGSGTPETTETLISNLQWMETCLEISKSAQRAPPINSRPVFADEVQPKDHIPNDIWRTLIADQIQLEGDSTLSGNDFLEVVQALRVSVKNRAKGAPSAALPVKHESARYYYAKMHTWLHERTFFVTKRGYVGLGPLTTSPGDTICVLQGAPVPHILGPKDCRELGCAWSLKGESFVQGLMYDGNGHEKDDADTINEELYIL